MMQQETKSNINKPFILFFLIVVFATSCNTNPKLYKKEFTEVEKESLADQFVTKLLRKYYQGSVSEVLVVQEALKFQPNDGGLWREIGIPYGKRGIAAEFYENYGKAVTNDPEGWQGWRGYMYLYFYRDYKRAIIDFDAIDDMTPNFVDYPQSTSVHYMRGICYMQLGQFDKAHKYWNKHIAEEIKMDGEEYIDSKTFLFQGITYYKQGNLLEAKKSIDRSLLYDSSTADLYYWKAKIAFEQKEFSTAKEAIEKAKYYFNLDSYNKRPYVEEFYQTYMLDIEELKHKIETNNIG